METSEEQDMRSLAVRSRRGTSADVPRSADRRRRLGAEAAMETGGRTGPAPGIPGAQSGPGQTEGTGGHGSRPRSSEGE